MINTVLKTLSENAYTPVPAPLRVAGVDFGFDAALVGPGDYGNLVVVVGDDGSDYTNVVRRVRSLMLVLSRSNSARPVTVVLVSPASSKAIEALSEFAHVVTVDPEGEERDVQRVLRSLLKLHMPKAIGPIQTEAVFTKALGSLRTDAASKAIISASRHGSAEVEATLLRLVSDAVQTPIAEALDD